MKSLRNPIALASSLALALAVPVAVAARTAHAADEQDTAAMSTVLSGLMEPGFHCALRIEDSDVILRSFRGTEPQFEFRLGPGGVLSRIQDLTEGEDLVMPEPGPGEWTSRSFGWMFSSSENSSVRVTPEDGDSRKLLQWLNPAHPEEYAFHLAQGGASKNLATAVDQDRSLAPTIEVFADARYCRVDIFSVARRQWRNELDYYMSGQLSSLTRYEIRGRGELQIRRLLMLGPINLKGKIVPFDRGQLVSWLPLNRAYFDSVAHSFTDDKYLKPRVNETIGGPQPVVLNGNAHPVSHFDLSGTAIAYAMENQKKGMVMAMAYGHQQPVCVNGPAGGGGCPHQYDLTGKTWAEGIALIPTLHLESLPTGTIIEQHLALAPGHGLSADFVQYQKEVAAVIPPPRVIYPSTPAETEKALQGEEPFYSLDYDFGGMYGYHWDFRERKLVAYPNPATGGPSCPNGYEAAKLLDTPNLDYPLFFCFKQHTPGHAPALEFGGMYGYHFDLNAPETKGLYTNPATSAPSCPPGFKATQSYGSPGVDFNVFFCSRPPEGAPGGGLAPPLEFGGMFGEHLDHSNPTEPKQPYPNPATGTKTCPTGYATQTFIGTQDRDLPAAFCYRKSRPRSILNALKRSFDLPGSRTDHLGVPGLLE